MSLKCGIDGNEGVDCKNESRTIVTLSDRESIEVICSHEGLTIHRVVDGIIESSDWKLWDEL